MTDVTAASLSDRDAWLELAKEMESVFEEPMVEDPEFRQYTIRAIQESKVFVARSESRVAGIVAVSVSKNSITWLGSIREVQTPRRRVGTPVSRN